MKLFIELIAAFDLRLRILLLRPTRSAHRLQGVDQRVARKEHIEASEPRVLDKYF